MIVRLLTVLLTAAAATSRPSAPVLSTSAAANRSTCVPTCFGVVSFQGGWQLDCANPCAPLGCTKINVELADGTYDKCSCGDSDACCDVVMKPSEGPRKDGRCGDGCPGAGQCDLVVSQGEFSSKCANIHPQ